MLTFHCIFEEVLIEVRYDAIAVPVSVEVFHKVLCHWNLPVEISGGGSWMHHKPLNGPSLPGPFGAISAMFIIYSSFD